MRIYIILAAAILIGASVLSCAGGNNSDNNQKDALAAAGDATTQSSEYICSGVFIPSGYMGDAANKNCDGVLKMSNDTAHGRDGGVAERWEYRPSFGVEGWVAVSYQSPANNWGDDPGVNLQDKGFTKLTFWARGENGGERVTFKALGGTKEGAANPASAKEITLGTVKLTTEYRQITIELDNADLSNCPTALITALNSQLDPDGAVFYIQDIKFQ